MSLNDFIRNITHLIFIIIGLITLWDYLRGRNETRLKIMLLFGSIMWTVVLSRINQLFPEPNRLLTLTAQLILITFPYLLLLVVDLFHPAPRWLMRSVLVSTLVTAVVLLFFPQPFPPLVTLAIIAYFIIAMLYSVYVFVRDAFAKRGVVRQRMQLAALATLIFTMYFITAGVAAVVPTWSDNLALLQQILLALSGILYFFAFAAPRSLRRMWQFAELYRFLSQARAMTHQERLAQAADMLCQSATQVTHGQEAVILNFNRTQQQLQFPKGIAESPIDEHITTTSPALQSAVLQFVPAMAIRNGTRKSELSAGERQLLDNCDVDLVYYVPIRAIEGLYGILAVCLRDYPLFPEDDLHLLQLFAEQYGLMMEYGYHILEKERVIEELVDFTDVLKTTHEEERQRFFGVSQNLLAVRDNKNRFFLLNPAWERVLGYEYSEIMQMNLENLVHSDDREAMQHQLHRLEKGEDVSGFEARMVSKEGDIYWFSWWMSALPEHGTFYIAAHDITSVKAVEAEMQTLNDVLQQQGERLQQVIGTVPGIVWEAHGHPLDKTYQMTFVSDYVEQMLGYTVEETYTIPNFWFATMHPDDREQVVRDVEAFMERGGQATMEFRSVTKDKRIIWCLSHMSVLTDDEGNPVGRRGLAIDITPLKEAREQLETLNDALRQEQQRLQQVISTVPGIVWEARGMPLRGDYEVYFVSDYVEQMLGYTVAETRAIPDFWYNLLHPDDRGPANQRLAEIMQNGGQGTIEFRWLRKDGKPIWCLSQMTVLTDEEGRSIGRRGVTIDITPVKEAELARARLAAIVESSQDAIIGHTLDGIITSWNHGAEVVYGYLADEIVGQSIQKLWYQPPPNKMEVLKSTVLAGQHFLRSETHHIRKDGTVFDVSFATSPVRDSVGEVISASTIAHDITTLKKAELALQALNIQLMHEKERLAQVINNVPGAVWETYGNRQNNSFRTEFISDYIEQMLGYTSGEIRDNADFWLNVLYPDDRQMVSEQMRAIAQDGGQGTVEFRWLTKGGEAIWCLSRVSIIYDEHGNQIGQSGVTIDITPIKEAEQTRARLAAIVESSQDAIIGHTVDGIINTWNYGAEVMYGYAPDEIIGQFIQKLWFQPPPDKLQNLQEAINAGQYFERSDTHHIRKDGSIFAVSFTTSPVRDNAGKVISASTIVHDITPQKQTEEELRNYAAKLIQSNKALEEFAYIASHDLQEPLRKVQAFGDRLITRYTNVLDETGQDYLRRMQDAAGRMRNLISDLLTFSRLTSHPKDFEKVDLNAVLQNVVADLERRLQETRGRIMVDSLVTLDADPSQMYQLFQNLLSNSLKYHRPDVPPIIEISGEHVTFAPGAEPLYRITVKDNGIGFENKYSERIFNLFERLHSRSEYEGTGIGLAICRKIVEQHNGRITATAIPDEGATFTIIIPLKKRDILPYV